MVQHALLGASSAHRWLNCPPSARLTEHIADKGSSYAAEGTLAHALAEDQLNYYKDKGTLNGWEVPEKFKVNPLYYDSMVDDIAVYVNYVIETFESKSDAAVLELESRLDYSTWVPEGFGTGDAVIIDNDTLEVIDLKFGKGVVVDAEDNPQLKLYGLGALEANSYIYDIDKVSTTIVQPRLDHISTQTYSVWALQDWADKTVLPIAVLAYKGEGETKAGEWCKFCKLRATCETRAKYLDSIASLRTKNTLSDEELSTVLTNASEIRAWLSDVEENALKMVLDGYELPGWKVVEGRSNRKIKDPKALAADLLNQYSEEAIYKPKELLTLTGLEKLVGKKKFAEFYGDHIYKPEGKPTLVPEADKRPPLHSAEADFDYE